MDLQLGPDATQSPEFWGTLVPGPGELAWRSPLCSARPVGLMATWLQGPQLRSGDHRPAPRCRGNELTEGKSQASHKLKEQNPGGDLCYLDTTEGGDSDEEGIGDDDDDGCHLSKYPLCARMAPHAYTRRASERNSQRHQHHG